MSNNKKIKGGKKKMEQREITIKQYIETCPQCGKKIRGTSPASASHNLKVHLMACPSNNKNEKK